MTDQAEDKKGALVRRATRAAIVAIVLGLLCRALPPDYRGICETLVSVCTGGIK